MSLASLSYKRCENNPMHSRPQAEIIDLFRIREKKNNGLLRRAKQGQNGMMAVMFAEALPACGSLAGEAGIHPPRHCERSEAIRTVSAERLWIASLRSQ
jgi:hypothetical protein